MAEKPEARSHVRALLQRMRVVLVHARYVPALLCESVSPRFQQCDTSWLYSTFRGMPQLVSLRHTHSEE